MLEQAFMLLLAWHGPWNSCLIISRGVVISLTQLGNVFLGTKSVFSVL